MNIEKLEEKLHSLVSSLNKESFIYDLLLIYGQPKSSITRLQKGDYNLSKVEGEILWKKKLYFKQEDTSDLHVLIDQLKTDATIVKHHPRFIVITDFKSLLAIDTKTADTLDISLQDLAKHYDFFLPWAGMEKAQLQNENPADVKAAERMGRLYDLILEDNPTTEKDQIHALNIFLSRLLFCFFAEDTGIFKDGQFTNAIASHTAKDGNDLQVYLQKLFSILNLLDRTDYPQFLQDFPYVNGGLFADDYPVPVFSIKSRKIIIECGTLNWQAINPDIFGSMIQAVVHNEQRSHMGMHYTSVVNIMKVIEPLFLNDLYQAFEKAKNKENKLKKLLARLYNLRIFDPACGSGNFLIIAYKELCQLEIKIFRQLQTIDPVNWGHAVSGLHLNQFYGIELDDFAHETAKLSLWLTEHQMNLAFKEVFGETRPTLPLQDSGNITCENATRLDWEVVCPKLDDKGNEREVYILGNPPYLGARNQSKKQKGDISFVFENHKDYKDSDYVCCWFLKGAYYLYGHNSSLAFVSTNSIAQGEQVGYLWTRVLEKLEIGFAHQSFKWTNNAKGNAGVTCVVIGIRNKGDTPKHIFSDGIARVVKNISPYLHEGGHTIAYRAKQPISQVPKMVMGNMARDGGNLILTKEEAFDIKSNFPDASKLLRELYGAYEFLNSGMRWCLWITDENYNTAKKIKPINDRIERVYRFRISSKAKTTQQYATIPHKFAQRSHISDSLIILPRVSSERRTYIPFGFFNDGSIISDSAQVIYDPPTHTFAIISSRMHMTWVRTVAGRLETRIRYSSALCYNTFPFPEITEAQKTTLEDHVFKVLDERELHPEKTMAQLYDPDKMPDGLRKAHHEMDLAIEQCYRPQPFKSDDERLEYLFKLYEKMIGEEKLA